MAFPFQGKGPGPEGIQTKSNHFSDKIGRCGKSFTTGKVELKKEIGRQKRKEVTKKAKRSSLESRGIEPLPRPIYRRENMSQTEDTAMWNSFFLLLLLAALFARFDKTVESPGQPTYGTGG